MRRDWAGLLDIQKRTFFMVPLFLLGSLYSNGDQLAVRWIEMEALWQAASVGYLLLLFALYVAAMAGVKWCMYIGGGYMVIVSVGLFVMGAVVVVRPLGGNYSLDGNWASWLVMCVLTVCWVFSGWRLIRYAKSASLKKMNT